MVLNATSGQEYLEVVEVAIGELEKSPKRWLSCVGCQRNWTVLGPRDWGEEAPGLRVSLTS